MAYIDEILQPGERVVHTTKIHWIIFWRAIVLYGIALAALVVKLAQNNQDQDLGPFWVFLIFMILGTGALIRDWIRLITTEIVITNRKIVFKSGLFQRSTFEMNMTKVESVHVHQNMLGRVLDFGDVLVHGTGSASELFPEIRSPVQFRNYVVAE